MRGLIPICQARLQPICDALLYRLDVLGGLLGRRRCRRGWAFRPLAGLGKRRAAGKDQWQQAYETCHEHGRLSTGCVGALERPAADSRPLLPRPSEQGASNGLADLDIGEFPDYAKRKSGTGAVTQPKSGGVAPPAPYDCRTLDLVCDVRAAGHAAADRSQAEPGDEQGRPRPGAAVALAQDRIDSQSRHAGGAGCPLAQGS